MDRITKNYLDTFKREQSLDSLADPIAFEHFINYCVVSESYDDEFDVTEVHSGGGNDLGLDGIAIIANGALVTSSDEIKPLIDLNGSLDVTFIFIQSKTSEKFDGGEIGTFFDGVEDFFEEKLEAPLSDAVRHFRSIMQEIYNNSIRFRKEKPNCKLYYATTGQWTNDSYLTSKIDKWRDQLHSCGLFSKTSFNPMGADEIHSSYQRSKNSVTTEFIFANKSLLPDIAGVKEAYLGALPIQEFFKLITDDHGNLRKSLFTDNVRDFQGPNAVNNEIQKTLNEKTGRERFVVLNNGVTIVARNLYTTRDKLTVTDYQIVNGCQTSHVLFEQRDKLDNDVQVPVKLISTEDEDVISAIITTTNRQTQVTTEDLFARGAFAKKLEEFLRSFPGKQKLFYERRSKQYNSDTNVEKVRIITKLQQIRAFAAMFLDEPHRASSYYSELYPQVGDKIFSDGHKLEPYYASAYAHYKLEFLFRNNGISVDYKPARYHILMAVRYIAAGSDLPDLSSRKIRSYCSTIWELLWDNQAALDTFHAATSVIDRAKDGSSLTRDSTKTRAFTDSVKKELLR